MRLCNTWQQYFHVNKMKPFQPEMPVIGTTFNLSPETGIDIDRVLEQQRAQLARECSAKEFHAKMQRLLALTPGFIGADAPHSETAAGRVVIEPAYALDAMKWLKRRFRVAENIELSPDNGLAMDIMPRCRRGGVKRQKFTGSRVEQFQLHF